MSMKHFLLPAIVFSTLFLWNSKVQSQIVYGQRNGVLALFNIEDCTFCEKFPLTACGAPDVSVLPDGNVIWTCDVSGIVYDSLGNVIGGFSCAHEIQSTCMHNDTFYLGTSGGLYTVNLVNNQVSFIGAWASGMPSRIGLYSLYGNLFGSSAQQALDL